MSDYGEKLTEVYGDLRRRVEKNMLPLVARIPAIDKVAQEYALAQADYHRTLRSTPIKYGDDYAIERFADLVLHEELTWSHPDKMSIVEYPVMSGSQEDDRAKRFLPLPELEYGDLRHKGKRKVAIENKGGSFNVRNRRVFDIKDDGIDSVVMEMDVHHALDNAKLTPRQREIINLIFFDKLTQEEAAEHLSISQQAIAKSISTSLVKMRVYMTKE